MPETSREQHRPFTLVHGGLLYRFERRFRLTREPPPDPAIRIWAGAAITFLPLVVLAAMQGVLFGTAVRLPLLLDLTVYARFLIAMPLLVGSERAIDRQLAAAVQHFRTSGLVGAEGRRDLEAAIAKLERTRDSVVPEGLMLALAFVIGWLSTHAILGLPVSSWRAITPGIIGTTLAGRWLDLVSVPFFNFLAFRWLWRIALWSHFLWRVSRIHLELVPTHPDHAAGLGFLGEVHAVFGGFLVPLSATFAARGVQWVQYGEATLDMFRTGAIAYGVLALAITLGPLLVFVPQLLATKRRALIEYAGFSLDYTSRFDRKWLRGGRGRDEELLGTADIQSLADLANSFDIVRSMRLVPPGVRNAATLVLAIVLPMVPFLAFIIPLKQILKVLLQLVAS